MAWRIASHIVRGEIDNRIKGFVTGKIWLQGRPDPLQLNLCGHPEPDLAGRRLEFINPMPEEVIAFIDLLPVQKGLLGECTAGRKVKSPSAELDRASKAPFRECLYLEWFSECNGRVVIESTEFTLTRSEPAWSLTPEDSLAQQKLNANAWETFMQSLAMYFNQSTEPDDSDVCTSISTVDTDLADEEAIERLLRINELKHEADRLFQGQMSYSTLAPVPLAVEEQFWQNLVDFEKAPKRKRRDLLTCDGIAIPGPENLEGQDLTDALWAIVHGLAARSMYLFSTDHLSDRKLYSLLVDLILEDEVALLKPGSGWANHIFVDEYDTPEEESHVVYLRYYACEEERHRWAAAFPEDEIPPHEQPPYDRDRHLPQADWEGGM